MKLVSIRVLFATALLVLSIVFFACLKSNNNMNNTPPVSGLMAFNLATDKAVNITVAGNAISNYPLSFNSYTGNYLNVYSGSRLVQSYDFNSNNVLDSSTYNFEPQKLYSVFVMGTNGQYHNVIVKDNFDSLNTSQAYLRYVNAINDPSSPTVTISSSGNNVLETSAPFASVSGFTGVTPGSVTVQVSNGSNINKSRTINLDQQKAYTILLTGNPGSTANDSLQIKYVENGLFSENTHKGSSMSGSSATD